MFIYMHNIHFNIYIYILGSEDMCRRYCWPDCVCVCACVLLYYIYTHKIYIIHIIYISYMYIRFGVRVSCDAGGLIYVYIIHNI